METKYHNHAQLVQGVSQVNEKLSQGERLFLNCLAAYSVKTYPHPGNDKLMIACGIETRQGVNYVAKQLIRRGLIEILAHAKGGHGMAVQYRICTEDARFPEPRIAKEPASSDLQDEPASPELHVSYEQPASKHQSTRKYDPNNPQVEPDLPASSDLHPNLKAGLKSGFKNEYAADAGVIDDYTEPTDEQRIARYFEKRNKLIARGSSYGVSNLDRIFEMQFPELWDQVKPAPDGGTKPLHSEHAERLTGS